MASEEAWRGMDEKAHEKTYGGFIGLMKWGTVAALIVAAFVIFLLVR